MARRTIRASRAVASGSGGELVPEGTYEAVVDECEEVAVKNGVNKGEPMYRVRCKISEGEQKGRVATKWVCLFPGKEGKALISYYQLAAALGEPVVFDGDGDEEDVEIMEPREIIGEAVRIKIDHEPGRPDEDGNTQMTYKLSRFLPASAPAKSAGPTRAVASRKAGGRGKARVKI